MLEVNFQPNTEQLLSEGDETEVCVGRSNDLETTIEVNIDANTESGINYTTVLTFDPQLTLIIDLGLRSPVECSLSYFLGADRQSLYKCDRWN